MRRTRAVVTALLMASACGGSTVTDGAGPTTPPADTTRPPTTVQRASITARVVVDPADASIASTAGVTSAGLTVRLVRDAPGSSPLTATTAADGTVRFDNLLQGLYRLSVDRPLTPTELARLRPDDRDATLFVGAAELVLSPPTSGSREISLVATRRGSLVISELFSYSPGPPIFYGFGHYLEVYNNADTTAYLDGVLLFRTLVQMHSESPRPCTYSAPFRLDTTVVWANLVHAFPGSGRQYPIAPGTARVVAMDAIDHKSASPQTEQVDLSRAEFEEIGSEADTDNPFSANLERVLAGTGALGRGYPIGTRRSYGLALASARGRLSAGSFVFDEQIQFELRGIPRDAVLDIVSITYSPTERAGLEAIVGPVIDCTPWISPVFDRAVAPLSLGSMSRAWARKSLGMISSGRELLQRTRTSERDFEYGRPLRRSLDR